ncbi:MAG TPA: hypothetical protein VL379_16970 [Pseudomonadales bacterium]|nr:hypothetical protein [Pseudomonadales bacterium]
MEAGPTYCYSRLKGAQRNWQPLFDQLTAATLPALADAGVKRWGAWSGLFGIGSNELVLMTFADAAIDHVEALNAHIAGAPASIVEQHLLEPTVRPAAAHELTRAGLYVFRFFDVDNADVDAVAQLSLEAWTTFESATAYRAEPQGLFRLRDRSVAAGLMLLCTWYDGLESWQVSREPPPEAAENFRRRHALTRATIAYATRLITTS